MLFNFLINPLGAWRHRPVSGLYRRVSLEREVTPIPAAHLRAADPAAGILAGALRDKNRARGEGRVSRTRALSGSQLAGNLASEVDIALRNPRLKRIIWGVEFYTFDTYSDNCAPDTCARLDGDFGIKFRDSILSADALGPSWRMLLRAARGECDGAGADADSVAGALSFARMFAIRHPRPWPGWTRPALARGQQSARVPALRLFPADANNTSAKSSDRIRRAHVELIAFVAAGHRIRDWK